MNTRTTRRTIACATLFAAAAAFTPAWAADPATAMTKLMAVADQT